MSRNPHAWEDRVLVDATAEIDLGVWQNRDAEQYARALEREARDFHNFIKDHRSRDHYQISINRKFENRCRFCHAADEGLDSDGSPACCERAVEFAKSAQEVKP